MNLFNWLFGDTPTKSDKLVALSDLPKFCPLTGREIKWKAIPDSYDSMTGEGIFTSQPIKFEAVCNSSTRWSIEYLHWANDDERTVSLYSGDMPYRDQNKKATFIKENGKWVIHA